MKLRRLFAVALLGVTLSSCGLTVNQAVPYDIKPGSIQPIPALQGVKVTVGSKDFTENIILAYMTEMALTAAGAEVVDLSDIKGSNSSRQALLSGQTDVTWEYTGTGWINYQGNELPVPGGEKAQYEATAKADEEKFGVTWLNYSPLNDQYAFAVTEAYGAANNLKTTSDLAAFIKQKPDQAVFCLETEFTSRQDGFPAAVKAYGFQNPTVKNFGIGTIYSAVASGTCPVGEVFTTDGRISGLNLRVLEDDKKAFPQYNAVATLRTEWLNQHPEVRGPLEKISAAIDNEQMVELCKQVDVDGQDAGKVAHDWMVKKGFVK
ncbi:glycine/betaine ABC transporter periplasmic protein [Amycolatopsis mediterranei S699]|uniref:Periplasmic substrate-binding component of ABC-type glycine betaine transport system n=2 Tax=Amycolatopsis mediterranei TaxID=33910 RepID=A0A0H3CUG3_AMYMU|nr:glycine betaine ABC transporter substrate-binding protein [Amycolatopsis mediterranei]ADJ41923.1 periplasmic substrate-binding component of ABC-type glycine betaine transport system [Amycolatopsis mediterranei U32]AEK38595.1 glycine/betaine ABC transporter periplasmic protein [Amycolatopsis mediterranei S699]AFO73633.1 glycine/betaine ABC transporter periplasmic protein [Amycolatopsis mediterranei S699]AGT80762.1 glycine/betaine ABC transporter periplasmic protein [Amycolatopsis mediterranei